MKIIKDFFEHIRMWKTTSRLTSKDKEPFFYGTYCKKGKKSTSSTPILKDKSIRAVCIVCGYDKTESDDKIIKEHWELESKQKDRDYNKMGIVMG